MRIFLAALLLIACTCDELPFKKVIHNTDPNAKCLDGSPPALYVHEGGDPTKFIIFFNGGGACFGNSIAEVLENCYQRSKTDLGSSKGLKDEIIVNGGYLSTDPAKSKFAGWTKIIIEYCDGSVHQGNSLNGVKYKDTELFFRGAVNTRSHFAYLRTKYNFKDAGSVVLTGSSAGAQATALWINYVRSLLTDPSVMVSIPDSGVFLNVASPETGQYNQQTGLKNLYRVSNADEATPNSICNNFKRGQQYKCLMMEVLFTSLEGRILLINSQYDSEAIPDLLDIKCLKNGTSGKTLSGCNSSELANIQFYRKVYLSFITNFMHFSKNSIWTIACSQHVYAVWGEFYDAPAQKIPESSGMTVRNAIERFVLEGERINLVDQGPWPANSACAK